MDDTAAAAPRTRESERHRLDLFLTPEQLKRSLRNEALEGLTRSPKELSPKWFYDTRGSELFDQITHLPEYYPTRREREILQAHAHDIADLAWADTLVELGSGTSEKTRLLLDALDAKGSLRRFVPFDVSGATLEQACEQIGQEYPRLFVHGVVGDFDKHLSFLPRGGRRLIAFLGGTLGNFKPKARAKFLSELAATMGAGDSLLIGTDRVKETGRLNAAYDDAQGVTAEFNLNVLSVLNRELGADFKRGRFEHVARYDEDAQWIEMALRARERQTVNVRELGLQLTFEAGEELRTEVSAKFRPDQLEQELAAAGLSTLETWTDSAGDFALTLALPTGRTAQH
ncbi:MAG: L-histidine N(alpha)-methyltransferase [Myxococcaceae bacterium]